MSGILPVVERPSPWIHIGPEVKGRKDRAIAARGLEDRQIAVG